MNLLYSQVSSLLTNIINHLLFDNKNNINLKISNTLGFYLIISKE